jgi:hypothetical protein
MEPPEDAARILPGEFVRVIKTRLSQPSIVDSIA